MLVHAALYVQFKKISETEETDKFVSLKVSPVVMSTIPETSYMGLHGCIVGRLHIYIIIVGHFQWNYC